MTKDTQKSEPVVDLQETFFIDIQHPTVVDFANAATDPNAPAVEKAIALFYAVRDKIRYDPYSANLVRDQFKASATIERGSGFCVHKAIVLAAVARAVGVPARLRFADVINHLAPPGLIELMQTDVFAFHGYNEFHLNACWIKATPTFNRSMCEKFGVKTLEFDGRHDAILHSYDPKGRKHMEYIKDYGHFSDFPFDDMKQSWKRVYPRFFEMILNANR